MSILITENKQIINTDTKEVLSRMEYERKSFVWFNYNINSLKEKGFNKADIFRTFYLATFIDYNNVLRYDRHKWTKTDIRNKLNLSDRTFYRLFDKLIQNNILIESCNGDYEISDEYFYKGKVRKGWSPRIYCDKLQQIYKNSKPADHIKLGYGFSIMPCVNLKYNIICNDPLEFNLDKIEPLSLFEILDELKADHVLLKDFLDSQSIIKKYQNGFYIDPDVLLMGFDF